MIAGRDFSGGAAIDLYVKDLGIVDELGQAGQLSLPVTAAALAALQRAQLHGLGASDISAMVTEADRGAAG